MAGAGEPVSASALLDYTSAGTSLVAAYRTHGHLAARLDPLGTLAPDDPALHPEYHGLTEEAMRSIPARALRVYVDGETLWDVLPHLREIYCGTVAYEIEHLSSHEQRRWLREAIESRRFWVPTKVEEKRRLLIRLLRVEGLEMYLRRSFLGAKTFSIEGLDMMILMLDEAVLLAAEEGIEEAVFGMAHRGRLNVLAHVLRRPYRDIFAEFEGEHALDVETLRARPRLRRRQVPPRREHHPHLRGRRRDPRDPAVAGAEPVAPGVREPGRDGPHPRAARRSTRRRPRSPTTGAARSAS